MIFKYFPSLISWFKYEQALTKVNFKYKESLHVNSSRKIIIPSDSSFRYDINALRAIAVIGVLFYHFKLPYFAGGFAGVDIFFVISGYLMSRIIINSIENKEFSYIDYFTKRVKRIVPALLFLILSFTIISFFIYFPDDYMLSQRNAAGSTIFLSNILYWQDPYSYFASSSESNPFLHTWSLSVEWQFYLVYPIFLVISTYLLRSRTILLLFLIALTSLLFVSSIISAKFWDSASFYLLPTRSWEMLLGGISFLVEDFVKGFKWKNILAAVGYFSLFICFVLLKVSMIWPGIFTLLPVLGTFLVVVANHNGFPIIKHTIVQFIGKISYSLYLWHWPVYVISQYLGLRSSLENICLLTLISILIGYISYKYIESIRFTNSKYIIASVFSTFLITASLSYFPTNNILFKESTLKIANYDKMHSSEASRQYGKGSCFVGSASSFNKELCLCIQEGKRNILIVGDSHMGQLSQSLKEELNDHNVHILQATAEGTLPTLIDYQHNKNDLREIMDHVFLNFIPQHAKQIDCVVISGMWDDTRISRDSILIAIKETSAYLKKYGLKSIVIGQTEHYTIPYATIAARDFEYNTNSTHLYLEESAFEVDQYLSKELGTYYIKVNNVDSTPKLSTKLEPYMADNHHVTKYGADLIVNKILTNPVAKGLLIDAH